MVVAYSETEIDLALAELDFTYRTAIESARLRLAKLSVAELRILAVRFGCPDRDAVAMRRGDLVYEFADRLVEHEEAA